MSLPPARCDLRGQTRLPQGGAAAAAPAAASATTVAPLAAHCQVVCPCLSQGQVLVRMHLRPVNPADIFSIMGWAGWRGAVAAAMAS